MSATNNWSSTSSSSSSSISLPPIKILVKPSVKFLRLFDKPCFMRLNQPPFCSGSAVGSAILTDGCCVGAGCPWCWLCGIGDTDWGVAGVCSVDVWAASAIRGVSIIGTSCTGRLGIVASSKLVGWLLKLITTLLEALLLNWLLLISSPMVKFVIKILRCIKL